MRNAILRELQAEYELRRMADLREEQRRRDEAVAACPELGDMLQARQGMIYQGVQGILRGTAQAADLPARMEVYNRRVAKLLKDHGLPENYLDPVYQCARCKDTGYVGEPVREMCDCMRTAFYTRLYERVGLGEKAEQSFETFDQRVFSDAELPGQGISQRKVMLMLRDKCREYAEEYPHSEVNDLLLMGQSGLGKTFLMHAMAKKLLDRGMNVLMISAYRFLDIARRAYFSGNTGELDSLMETDVLLLDDLGSEPLMENITIVQFFNLINERQQSRRGTVLSTNLTVKELRERYTERIASRLLDKRQCALLMFVGDDVRRT